MNQGRGMSTQPEPRPLPDIDDRLAEPGTRFEVIDGEPVYVPPAKEPHAESHAGLIALVIAHLHADYKAAADLLTRVSLVDDIAPDVVVYPRARDPRTGGRQLPELAFEVASTQTLGDAAQKARLLVGRGVRRVFAIQVRHRRLLEWREAADDWGILSADAKIEDRVFAAPLCARDVVEAADTDDAVARALLAKENPVLVEREARARAEGLAAGAAQGRELACQEIVQEIRRLLESRGLIVSERLDRALAEERSLARLARWAGLAGSCIEADALLDSP